jgi:hypothetical protein
MGYYTNFTIEIKDAPCSPVTRYDLDLIAVRFKEVSHQSFYVEGSSLGLDESKWYRHEEDLKRISLEYPSYLFTVYGEGEDTEDLWVKYFLNGKMQSEKAEITYKEFDASKLV